MALKPLPIAQERRRHQRVKISVLGRYMLENRREYPCQAVNMSPGGIALVAPVVGNPGERVVAYLDHIGAGRRPDRAPSAEWFRDDGSATVRKREKLAAQLTWLANRHALNLPEDRRHERILPKNPRTTLTLANGIVASLPRHRHVVVGRRRGDRSAHRDRQRRHARADASRVVRHFEGGIALIPRTSSSLRCSRPSSADFRVRTHNRRPHVARLPPLLGPKQRRNPLPDGS